MDILLSLALKSFLVAAVALLALRLTARRSASERSLIAHLGLVALVALPVASLALPAIPLPLPELVQATSETAATPAADAAPVVSEPYRPAAVAGVDRAASDAAAREIFANMEWSRVAYFLPALALLGVTLVALMRLVALRRRAQVMVDPTWLAALAHAQRRMGFKNGTALLSSPDLASPISWGLMRPVILLSEQALEAGEDAEAIIAHELAHVAGLDWGKLILSRVVTALFWFNPLAWVLAREAHQLREEAADDAVLAARIEGADYARLLVGVARHECRGLLLGAHGVAPSGGSLRRRVGRVLDDSVPRGAPGRSWVAGFATGMLAMAAPLAAATFSPTDAAADKPAGDAPAYGAAVDSGMGAYASQHAAPRPFVAPHSSVKVLPAPAAPARFAQADGVDAVEPPPPPPPPPPAPPRRHHKSDMLERVIEMKAVGLTPDYIAAMKRAGPQFAHSRFDDFVEMRAVGVTPEFVRELSEAGFHNATAEQITEARAVGLTPAYVRSMMKAGVKGSLEDYGEMRVLGIGPGDAARVNAMREADDS